MKRPSPRPLLAAVRDARSKGRKSFSCSAAGIGPPGFAMAIRTGSPPSAATVMRAPGGPWGERVLEHVADELRDAIGIERSAQIALRRQAHLATRVSHRGFVDHLAQDGGEIYVASRKR